MQALRQRLPELPECARRKALLQAQAAVAMLVLPGLLARRMQQSRGWRTPAQMTALLSSFLPVVRSRVALV